jgi:hypothetical protein
MLKIRQVRNPLEHVHPVLGESDPGAGHQVFHGTRQSVTGRIAESVNPRVKPSTLGQSAYTSGLNVSVPGTRATFPYGECVAI